MKYALLIYVKPNGDDHLSEDERAAVTREYFAIRDHPNCIDGAHLQPLESATTVRQDNGHPLITDGPFADTKEFLGGYYVFEADDVDPVLEAPARIPAARMGGAIEVRPLVECVDRARIPRVLGPRASPRWSASSATSTWPRRPPRRRSRSPPSAGPRDGPPAQPLAWLIDHGAPTGDRPRSPRAHAGRQDPAARDLRGRRG